MCSLYTRADFEIATVRSLLIFAYGLYKEASQMLTLPLSSEFSILIPNTAHTCIHAHIHTHTGCVWVLPALFLHPEERQS